MTATLAPDARQLRPYPYLEHPLSVQDIDGRRGALGAERQRRERRGSWVLASWALIFVILGVAIFAAVVHRMDVSNWCFGLVDVLLVPSMMVMVTLMASHVHRYEADLGTVPEENEAELHWLLDRLPEGAMLREVTAAHPRAYLVGELEALRTLWREKKAALAADARKIPSSRTP